VVIERIERSTLGETVLDRLGALIRAGTFPPGSRLPPERDLAAGFGVARGAVREALRALALAGLVDIRPGRGTFVCEALPATPPGESLAHILADQTRGIREVYQARRLIESELYRLATGRLTADDFGKLRRLLDRMHELEHRNGDRREFARIHVEFDAVVAEASSNRVLTYLSRQLRDLKLSAHEQLLRVPAAMRISNATHERLLKAWQSGRQDLVAEAAKDHFGAVEHFIDLLETSDD
jgi:GntR family transcriptional regulator, transcriptional repressor for pyruvate dehydrogenase complex